MSRSIPNRSGTHFPRANRFLLFAATACAGLLLGGARNTQAAFNVAQNGDTLTIKGPIVNYGDTVLIVGTGSASAQVEVWDCGVFAGAFNKVAHISVAVSGGNRVTVRVLGVDVSGSLAIKTGQGPDGVLLVSNQIGGKVQVWSGAGDDTIDVQHNLCDGHLSVVSAGGVDYVGLRDNDILGDVTLETAAGSDDVGLCDNDILGDVTLDAGADDDVVNLRDNSIAGNAAIASGAGNDDVDVGYPVNGTPYSANTIRGDLTIASSGGGDYFDVDSNLIRGNVVLAAAAGGSNFELLLNRVDGSVSVTTADGMDTVTVYTNEIGADLSITTGASNWPKYVLVEQQNQVRGDVSINVAPCDFTVISVDTNDIRRDLAVALGATATYPWIEVEWNMLHGNATVDTTTSADIVLDWNTVLGTLSVHTGDEGDSVELGDNVCDSDVTIELGDGDDDLTLGHPPTGSDPNQFAAQLTVDGGAGFDQLRHNLLNSYGVPPSSQGFESIVP